MNKQLLITVIGLVVGVAILGGLIWYVTNNMGEAAHFVDLFVRANFAWLVLALVLQVGTYICMAGIWYLVAHTAGHQLPFTLLTRVAIEKLGVDQLIPSAGMSGNLLMGKIVKSHGLPEKVPTMMVIADIMSRMYSLIIISVFVLITLAMGDKLSDAILIAICIFVFVTGGLLTAITAVLHKRKLRFAGFLHRFAIARKTEELLNSVTPKDVLVPKLLIGTTLLQLAMVTLDAATLWAVLQAIGTPTHFGVAFTSLAGSTLLGAISLLPAGLGSFEASSTAMLTLLGVPVAAALAGTLMLRVFTLWLPFIPAILIAQRDIRK